MDTNVLVTRGLIEDMPSDDYHSISGTFSSSQLKDLLDDPEYFYRKHITKEVERETSPAFDVGSYFHTGVLEPHKLKQECAVYGGIRRGKEWDKFKEDNVGKVIITKTEEDVAKGLIKSVQNSPIAMGRIKRGKPEVSAFVELAIVDGTIFETSRNVFLGKYGWEQSKKKIPKDSIKLIIKARADLLATDFILDLKSTTGNAKSEYTMKKKISDYNYDLSASLYLDIFSIKADRKIQDFIWTFASKDYYNSKSYLASADNILVGRAKWRKAILALAEGVSCDWQFEDSLGILSPQQFELEYIKTKAEDLL